MNGLLGREVPASSLVVAIDPGKAFIGYGSRAVSAG